MNTYQRHALEIRKRVSKLTLDEQKELLKIYSDSIDSLASKTTKSKNLSNRWLLDYKKELTKVKKDLRKNINIQVRNATKKAAEITVEGQQEMLVQMFQLAGIDTGNHFTSMFSQVQTNVVEDIISGRLYKDNGTLSKRIWSHSDKFEKDIQYIINRGILEKKSALELARDLEQFVKDPAKRPWNWGNVYPSLRGTKIDYNAQRLARTCINHSYQTATIKSSSMNPFVDGIEWQSAMVHGRTCGICSERHGNIYATDGVPLDHPNGLCTMLPYISKSLDAVADELRVWLDGGNNSNLDDWYNDYGDYFAFKNVGKIRNEGLQDVVNKNKKGYNNSNKNIIILDSQFGKKARKHVQDYGLNVTKAEDRSKFKTIIEDIVYNSDELRVGNWRGQSDDVYFYIKDEDVVILKQSGEFITILKGGIDNARIKDARRK